MSRGAPGAGEMGKIGGRDGGDEDGEEITSTSIVLKSLPISPAQEAHPLTYSPAQEAHLLKKLLFLSQGAVPE